MEKCHIYNSFDQGYLFVSLLFFFFQKNTKTIEYNKTLCIETFIVAINNRKIYHRTMLLFLIRSYVLSFYWQNKMRKGKCVRNYYFYNICCLLSF